MRKITGVFITECVIGLLLILLAAIALTGGLSLSFGLFNISARSLRNPLIFLGIALILRRVLAGSFFKNSPVFGGLSRFLRLAELRKWLLRPDAPALAAPQPAPASLRPILAAFAGFLALTLLWAFPVIKNFSTTMFGVGGDRYIYLWDMWWMKTALLDLRVNPLKTDYLFYPGGVSLAFHDFSIFNALVSVPLQYLFTREEIYNVLYLSTFIIGGFGCVLLLRYLTGSAAAGAISGLIFVFWGGRAYYVDHLSLASIQWFPFCALFLIKTLREPSYRNPALAALFFAINALSAWYYAVYMTLFAALFLIYAALAERKQAFTLAFLKRLAALTLIFLVIMLPLLLPMFGQIAAGDDYMVSPVYELDAASLNTLLLPSVNHDLIGNYVSAIYKKHDLPIQVGIPGASFLGCATMLLGLYAIKKLRHLQIGFWLAAFAVFLILAMGPHPALFSKIYASIPLPYQMLRHLPVLNIVRIPVRFMVVAMFCASVLAGFACWDIFRRTRFKPVVFVLLAALILFEHFRFAYHSPVEKIPQFYQQLGQNNDDAAILEITRLFNWEHASVRSSLFQTAHRKKLFHGHASRVPWDAYRQAYAPYVIFDDLFTLSDEKKAFYTTQQYVTPYYYATLEKADILEILTHYRARWVALYHDYWYGDYHANIKRLTAIFGEPAAVEGGVTFFRVEQRPPSQNLVFPGLGVMPLQEGEDGIPFRRVCVTADFSALNVTHAKSLRLQFQGQSVTQPADAVRVFVNGALMSTTPITREWTDIAVSAAPLQPGLNVIQIMTDRRERWKDGIRIRSLDINFER